MTAHLLLITIGPVQEFIAAARRSRDLWYGSHLLSELSRWVAREIASQGGELIFPAFGPADSELEECLTPTRSGGKPPVAVANIVLAKVERDGASIETLAGQVRNNLQEYWATVAKDVKANCADLIESSANEAWDEQIRTFLEFSAAWTPIEKPEDYKRAREAVAKAIAERKNLRDFEPWTNQRGTDGKGFAKSSLDGARETILRNSKSRPKKLVRRYRIGEGEELDAIGLVKRAGGETAASIRAKAMQGKEQKENELQFVPIVNVALGPWLKMAKSARKDDFAKLELEAHRIGLAYVARHLPCVEVFKYDASIFLENRLWPTFEEQGLLEKSDEQRWKKEVQEWGKNFIDPILARPVKKPYPYVACLVADGDRMGAAISGLPSHEEHFKFSQELARFPDEAREIVEKYMGSLVYSGADDVLAFLPLPTALDCAEELRKKFKEIMDAPCQAFKKSERPTLSVGLGIGHVLEGMGDLLNLGRAAEKLAKGGTLQKDERRNALGIIVDKRSGGKISWRRQWEQDPAGRLKRDTGLLGDDLSVRKLFEIWDTLRRLPKPEPDLDSRWAGVLSDEVKRSLRRTEGGALALEPGPLGLNLNGGIYEDVHKAASVWIDRLLIAKTFVQAKVASANETKRAAA